MSADSPTIMAPAIMLNMLKMGVIVGAGQAGLAAARALLDAGIPANELLIVDAAPSPAHLSWRSRWDSLTLFAPEWFSALPGMPMVGNKRRYPAGVEIADYLDRYRENLGIEVLWGTRAEGVSEAGNALRLDTSSGSVPSKNVIAATGPFTVPRKPSYADSLTVAGANMHSHQYRNPQQLSPGKVLVVGAGNTGQQIARELASTHTVTLAGTPPSRRLPQKVLGIDIFRLLKLTGLLHVHGSSWLGQKMAAEEVIIGPGIRDLGRRGVTFAPRVTGVRGSEVTFDGGQSAEFGSVIWATGYDHGFGWLPGRVVDGCRVVHDRGVTSFDGLYIVGMAWQENRASALIGGVGKDARRIVRHIVQRNGGQ